MNWENFIISLCWFFRKWLYAHVSRVTYFIATCVSWTRWYSGYSFNSHHVWDQHIGLIILTDHDSNMCSAKLDPTGVETGIYDIRAKVVAADALVMLRVRSFFLSNWQQMYVLRNQDALNYPHYTRSLGEILMKTDWRLEREFYRITRCIATKSYLGYSCFLGRLLAQNNAHYH